MRNRPYGFEIYLVNVKTIRTIAQSFVAFSEKLNFKLGSEHYHEIFSLKWCLHFHDNHQIGSANVNTVFRKEK